VIQELEESQTALENRSRELEIALKDLKALQVKLVESEKRSALGDRFGSDNSLAPKLIIMSN
jgi:hypothetical protein